MFADHTWSFLRGGDADSLAAGLPDADGLIGGGAGRPYRERDGRMTGRVRGVSRVCGPFRRGLGVRVVVAGIDRRAPGPIVTRMAL